MHQFGSDIRSTKYFYLSRSRHFIVGLILFSVVLAIGIQAWSLSLPQVPPHRRCPKEVWVPLTESERLARFWGLTAVLSGLGAASLLLLRAKFRVDEHGIARRRWFGWRMFDWDSLRESYRPSLCAGQVIPFADQSIVEKLLLPLSFMDERDQHEIQNLLMPEGTSTHLAPLPDRFRLRLRPFQGELELRDDGLVWEGRAGVTEFRWEAVQQVRVTKHTHARPTLGSIEIQIDGNRLKAYLLKETLETETTCNCDPRHLLMRFLRTKVPPERILELAQHGPPKTLAEAEFRLTETKKILAVISALCLLAALGWAFLILQNFRASDGLGWNLLKIGVSAILVLPPLGAPFLMYKQMCPVLKDFIERERATATDDRNPH